MARHSDVQVWYRVWMDRQFFLSVVTETDDGSAVIFGATLSSEPSWFESPMGKSLALRFFRLLICTGIPETQTAVSVRLMQASDEEAIDSGGCYWLWLYHSGHSRVLSFQEWQEGFWVSDDKTEQSSIFLLLDLFRWSDDGTMMWFSKTAPKGLRNATKIRCLSTMPSDLNSIESSWKNISNDLYFFVVLPSFIMHANVALYLWVPILNLWKTEVPSKILNISGFNGLAKKVTRFFDWNSKIRDLRDGLQLQFRKALNSWKFRNRSFIRAPNSDPKVSLLIWNFGILWTRMDTSFVDTFFFFVVEWLWQCYINNLVYDVLSIPRSVLSADLMNYVIPLDPACFSGLLLDLKRKGWTGVTEIWLKCFLFFMLLNCVFELVLWFCQRQ